MDANDDKKGNQAMLHEYPQDSLSGWRTVMLQPTSIPASDVQLLYIYIYTYMFIFIYRYTCFYIFTYDHIYTYVYVCMYMYLY